MNQETEKVLFVDDEPNILDMFRRTLRGRFDVDISLGAREALGKMEENGPYAVVISDFNMPEMNGIELLGRIKEEYPDTIRIMLTGFADLQIAMDAINKGDIFRFLTKPTGLKDLSRVISASLEQYRLVMDRRELHALRRLKEAMEGIILGFSQAVEAKDPYTAGHQRRVSQLAVAIVSSLGWEEDRITGLRMAAMVHDLGKIYIPSEYLNKPGSLSELEFSIIRTHPTVARDILKSVDFNWPISDIVAQHHERLDGSGYPLGLKGDEIILEARILAVADVVEAISSHRPYRPSLGIKKALAEIKNNQGAIYDPLVVETCLLLFEKNEFSFDE